ncbi:MAG: rhodanese-like domain-containing protein [Planctomycetota bacterium]|nr:rhodanese-like domain-containing protein [Planctomycetota bacterium]
MTLPPKPELNEQGLPVGQTLNEDWEITPRETRDLLKASSEGFLLLDCRRDEEIATCRIEGSVHVPMDEIPTRMDELEDHIDSKIVVYCHTGRRSLRVASLLRSQGFKDVRSMAGGIELWTLDIDPSVPRY